MTPYQLHQQIIQSEEYRNGKWLACLRKFLPQLAEYRVEFQARTIIDPDIEQLRSLYRKLYLSQTMPTGEVEIDADIDSYTGVMHEDVEAPEYSRKSRLVMMRSLWARVRNITERYDPVFQLDWTRIHVVSNTWKMCARYLQLQRRATALEKHSPYENFPEQREVYRIATTRGNSIKHFVLPRNTVFGLYLAAQLGNEAGYLGEQELDDQEEEVAQATALYGIQQSELPVYLQSEVDQTDWDDIERLQSTTNQIASELRYVIEQSTITAEWEPVLAFRRIEASPETVYAMVKRACGYLVEEGVERKKELETAIWKSNRKAQCESEKGNTDGVKQALRTKKVAKRELSKAFRKMSFYRNLDAIMGCFLCVTPDRVINLDDWYDLYAEEIAEQGYNARKFAGEISPESRELLDKIETEMFAGLPETHDNPSRTHLFNKTLFYFLMDERKDVKLALKEATRAYCQKYPYIGLKIENGVAFFKNRWNEYRHGATVRREITSGTIEITSHQRTTLSAIQDRLTQFEQREWKKLLA